MRQSFTSAMVSRSGLSRVYDAGYSIFKAIAPVALLLLVEANANAQSNAAEKDLITSERNTADGTYRSLTFSGAVRWNTTQAKEVFAKYFGIDGLENTMIAGNTTQTKNGTAISRYTQYYKGIKVALSNASVMSRDGQIRFISGNYYKINKALPATPAISEAAALGKALAQVKAEKYMWQEDSRFSEGAEYPKGELVWIEDMSKETSDRQLHLAYAFNIYASQPLSRDMIYVDANTGAILFVNPLLHHTASSGASMYSGTVNFQSTRTDSTYRLRDSTRGKGINTYTCSNVKALQKTNITSNTPIFSSDAASLDAHWGAAKVFDYWVNEQGRNSIDDKGMEINSYTHYDVGYNNAFWNGSAMVYGDGTGQAAGGFSSLVSLDVCAHEIGHGICQHTAGLIYQKESGAMNEGFSDIWGAVIENYANPNETDAMAKNIWAIGEEIGRDPLRSMSNPSVLDQPDTYGGLYWVKVTNCTPAKDNDQCGVHTNSGVLNYWFYLLCMGGSGKNDANNNYAVTGVGIDKGADIAYQTELLLSPDATFADCRTASINAAIALYGACSAEEKAVTKAWYAVGVGKNYTDSIGIVGSSEVCEGASLNLFAAIGGAWVSSNTSTATVDSTGVLVGKLAGTTTISYSVGLDCNANKVVTVTPSPAAIAGASSVYAGESVTLSNAISGGVWRTKDTAVATVDSLSGTIAGIAEGDAAIIYSIGQCQTFKTIKVARLIRGDGEDEAISLFPNPTNGSFTVMANEAGVLSVYTLDGREIAKYEIASGKTQVTLSRDLARGVYMCRYKGSHGSRVVMKLVTE